MVGVVLGTVGRASGILKWRAARTVDVRRLAVEFRAFLQDEVLGGGAHSSDFMNPARKANERELGDLIEAVHDRKLRQALEQLRVAYRKTFAAARPATVGYISSVETPEEVGERKRNAKFRELQREAAESGLDAVRAVLARVNKLERYLLLA